MKSKKCGDIVTHEVFEFDLAKLKNSIEEHNIKELVIWGTGNNGKAAYRLLTKLGVKITYFIDLKAEHGYRLYNRKRVIAPGEFKEKWNGEYVLVTPSIHTSILKWLEANEIPKSKIIIPFYVTEKICFDYGTRFTSVSKDIPFSKDGEKKPSATFTSIVYNTPEHMLRRAIESVLRQTCPNFAYVIIINGATDNSLAIANEYAALDRRITVINMQKNYRWTEKELLFAIKDNIYGDYWCQLDSDDYYSANFLEEVLHIGTENNADIVCSRTCLFCNDESYDSFSDLSKYDFLDGYYFNMVHPRSHIIGHVNIMTAYANSEICSTFWGKLYKSSIMLCFLNHLIEMETKERELYYRLDISWTYHVLSLSERVFYSDKVFHFASIRKSNSTFTLAPIEWFMALCYTYSNIEREMDMYHIQKRAHRYSRNFLQTHLWWMVNRKIDLLNTTEHTSKDLILKNLESMFEDEIFKRLLLHNHGVEKNEYRKFYNDIAAVLNSIVQ